MKKHLLYGMVLLLIAGGVLLPLLHGEFIFDDAGIFVADSEFRNLRSLGEVWHYSPQPARIVANFFLALGQWLAPTTVLAHRLLSILLHMMTTLVLYVVLSYRSARVAPFTSPALAFLAAALFAVHPLITEAAAVAQFRCDMLGTFFTWLALLCLRFLSSDRRSRKERWRVEALLYCFVAVAVFSKEIFLVTTPAILLIFAAGTMPLLAERKAFYRRFAFFLLACALFLVARLRIPAAEHVTYKGFIGWAVLRSSEYFTFISRAILEAAAKLFCGYDLTMVRISERDGLGSQWPWAAHVSVLLFWLAAGVLSTRLPKPSRQLVLSFWASVTLYFLLPNRNVGSEHYLYCACTFFAASLMVTATGLQTFHPDKVVRWSLVCGLLYACFFAVVLETRLFDLRDNLSLHLAEVDAHPESQNWWFYLLEEATHRTKNVNAVLPLVEKASERFPDWPYLDVLRFNADLQGAQAKEAEATLARLDQHLEIGAEQVALLHGQLAAYFGRQGDCFSAKRHIAKAGIVAPDSAKVKLALHHFSRQFCQK